MCGRLVQEFPSVRALEAFFGPLVGPLVDEGLPPHFNVCPGQPVAVIREAGAARRLDLLRWGLVSPRAADPAEGLKRINARSETVAERQAFREPFARRRCVVPSNGFYEWKRRGSGSQPLYFHLAAGTPLALAGLWDTWKSPEGRSLETFTILTVPPNALVAPIHDRMPAVLSREQVSTWLSPTAEPRALQALLVPYGGGDLTLHPVSPRMNDGRLDDRTCIEPAAERQLTLL